MKKIIFPLAVCLCFVSFQRSDDLQKGSVAPDFTVITANGEQFKLSDVRGSVVFIDFWASWCLPCRRQNILLLKIQEKYRLVAKRTGIPVFFLSISLDTNKEFWKTAIVKDNMNLKKQACDLKGWDSEMAKLYQVKKIPTSFLIGTDGKIAGKDLWESALDEALDKLLKQQSN
ncbi:MAG: TlpA family protein disulfide reductase [Bacteroidia bacterium]